MGKSDLERDLVASRDALLAWYDGTSTDQRALPLTPEGWTLQDFIGHLSFSEQLTLNHIRDTLTQGRPTPLPADLLNDDLNARAAAVRKTWDWARVRAEFQNTRNALIQRVEGLNESNLEFHVPSPWVNDNRILTLETLIREDVLEHGDTHRAEIETWLAAPTPPNVRT